MKLPRYRFLAAVLAGMVLLAGCSKSGGGGAAADGDTIRIGEFASLTGKEAFGQSSHRNAAGH
jgi:hypothetical protein